MPFVAAIDILACTRASHYASHGNDGPLHPRLRLLAFPLPGMLLISSFYLLIADKLPLSFPLPT